MKIPARPTETPPGGWRWKDSETGHVLGAGNFEELVRSVRRFLSNNGRPVSSKLPEEILDWLDTTIQTDMQKRGLPAYPLISNATPLSPAALAAQFAHAMAGWAASGFKLVNRATLQSRREICAGCEHFNGEAAFGVGSCGKCGCTSLKLFLATQRCPLNPPKWEAEA